MRHTNHQLREISIKVPGPFAGISDLGFTTQYRPQDLSQPLRDVPLVIEGPRPPIKKLVELLQLLSDAPESGHSWSDPIMVSDEVVLLAFRDRSLTGRALTGSVPAMKEHVLNMVWPVVFPFLHDCAVIAHLRLSDVIEMHVTSDRDTIAAMAVPLDVIVQANGDRLLWQVAG